MIVSSIDIARPPEEVYAYATDPTRFPEWQQDVVRVRVEGSAPLAVGGWFTTVRRIGPAERSMTQAVVARDEPRHWAVRGIDGPIRPTAEITVEPLPDGAGSRVTFALDFAGAGPGQLLVPLLRRMAAKAAPVSYRALKERLESRGG
jgi:uncharacterized protein YndB with AHSA1/START domain